MESRRFIVPVVAAVTGFGLRLAAVPFAQTTEGDAVARVYGALDWLQSPRFLLGEVWLPLQTYYMAAALWLTGDTVWTPVLINCLLSSLTAIPLYFFTRTALGSPSAGFVAFAFALYPLAFRNSLMALSDTPAAFFVALALWAAARAHAEGGGARHAVAGGLALTLASAVRYETWFLTPLIGLALWRKPRLMVLFVATAAIWPCIWLLGSFVRTGDPFYSFNLQVADTAATLAARGGMTPLRRLVRVLFVPGVLVFGMTVPVFCLAVWGVIRSLRQNRESAVWLAGFFGLFALFAYKSATGTMNLQLRYLLLVGMLLLPFAAVGLDGIRSRRLRLATAVSVLVLMLPLSYVLHVVRPVLRLVLADTRMGKKESPESLLEAVPRWAPSTVELARGVDQAMGSPRGALLIVDLPEAGTLLAYPTGMYPDQLAFLSLPHEREMTERLLRRHPSGHLLASRTFADMVDPAGRPPAWFLGERLNVTLAEVARFDDAVLFSYSPAGEAASPLATPTGGTQPIPARP